MFQKLAVSMLALLATTYLSPASGQEETVPAEEAAPAAEPAAATATAAPEPAGATSAEPIVPPPASETVATIPVAEAPAAPPADGEATQLDDVVVTARKRQESLQEVPLSVTAYNAPDMERRGFTGLEDIARATAGFTFEPYMTGGAHAAPVIRGLAQTFTTARIQNVSFFLDGVYLQRQSMLDLGMVDMERIEVMKGPQNALYGRNAFAGAINYITLEPGTSPEGYLMLGLGDNDRRQYRGSLTGPLDEAGTILGKVTAGIGKYEGHTRNDHPVADADPAGENLRGNLGGNDDQTYAVSLAWAPDFIDGLRVRASYYYSDLVHETGPGYSISGVHAGRFSLRRDEENDLNCLPATIQKIGDPSPSATASGNSAWCGELPVNASDVAPRDRNGMVIDPRAIGSTSKTGLSLLSADYEFSDAVSMHYMFGMADHNSYTDGGASDEDPIRGRGLYANAPGDYQDENNYYYVNTSSGRPNSELEEFSHELRFDWEFSDRLRFGLGGYYSIVQDEEWTSLYISDLCNTGPGQIDGTQNVDNCNLPLSAPNHFAEYLRQEGTVTAAPAYDQAVRQHGGRNRGEWSAFEDTIVAMFGSASYDFTDAIEATLEVRVSQEDKAIERKTDAFMLRPGEFVEYDPLEHPVLPFGNRINSTIPVENARDSASFTDVAPRAIVNWDWAKDHMVYLSAAKGVKAGGFNNSATPDEQTYEPETNWTYELGSKNRFWHGAFTLNGSVYFIDWTELQGSTPPADASLSSSDIVSNIGGATSMGVELESALFFTRSISLDGAFSYSDPKYDDGVIYSASRAAGADSATESSRKIWCDDVICARNGDVGGNQLARTPKMKYSLGLNYGQDIGRWTLTGRLDTNYQSKQYVEPVNLSWVPARQVTNASLKVNFPDFRWELSGWVKNLTDEQYAANSFYIGVFDQYMVGTGAGRTLGATLKYKF